MNNLIYDSRGLKKFIYFQCPFCAKFRSETFDKIKGVSDEASKLSKSEDDEEKKDEEESK